MDGDPDCYLPTGNMEYGVHLAHLSSVRSEEQDEPTIILVAEDGLKEYNSSIDERMLVCFKQIQDICDL